MWWCDDVMVWWCRGVMCVWLKIFSLTGKSKLSTYIRRVWVFPPMSTLRLDWHHLRNKRNPFSLLFFFCASLSSEEWGEATVHRPTTGARGQETVVLKNSQRTLAHRTQVLVCGCHCGICLCIAHTIKRNSHGSPIKTLKMNSSSFSQRCILHLGPTLRLD